MLDNLRVHPSEASPIPFCYALYSRRLTFVNYINNFYTRASRCVDQGEVLAGRL